jgi:hypothetical protein
MSAASLPPHFSNSTSASHQGRSVSRIANVARIVAAPAVAGVANSVAASSNASAVKSAQHRNIRAGR